MSVIIKKFILSTILLLLFTFSFAQEKNKDKNNPILIEQEDQLLSFYSISKDTISCSIGIYINGFESKNKREKATNHYKKNGSNNSIGLPTFSVNFISFIKPEKIISLKNIKYSKLKDFNSKNPILNPTYFLVKQNDGTYLKWKTSIVSIE